MNKTIKEVMENLYVLSKSIEPDYFFRYLISSPEKTTVLFAPKSKLVLKRDGKNVSIEDNYWKNRGLIYLNEDTRGLVDWVGKALYGWKFRSTKVDWPEDMKSYQFIEYVQRYMTFELPPVPKKTQKDSRLSKQDKMIINALSMRIESITRPINIEAVEHLLKLRGREIPKALNYYLKTYSYLPMEQMVVRFLGQIPVQDNEGYITVDGAEWYKFEIQWFIRDKKYHQDRVEEATKKDLKKITRRSEFESIFEPRWGHHFLINELQFQQIEDGMYDEPNLVITTIVTFKTRKQDSNIVKKELEFLKDKDYNRWNNYIVSNLFGARTPVMKKPQFFIW